MKKLVLLGVIALGSMSFMPNVTMIDGDDCWSEADAAVAYVEANAYYIAPGGLDNVWFHIFESCCNAAGQQTVIITVSK
jgi:hypothetical protein